MLTTLCSIPTVLIGSLTAVGDGYTLIQLEDETAPLAAGLHINPIPTVMIILMTLLMAAAVLTYRSERLKLVEEIRELDGKQKLKRFISLTELKQIIEALRDKEEGEKLDAIDIGVR